MFKVEGNIEFVAYQKQIIERIFFLLNFHFMQRNGVASPDRAHQSSIRA